MAVYLWILVGLAYNSLVIRFICKIFSKAGSVKRKANEKLGSHRVSTFLVISLPPPQIKRFHIYLIHLAFSNCFYLTMQQKVSYYIIL